MQFSISSEQLAFFNKSKFITFDNLLSPEEVAPIYTEIQNAKKRFDLWRTSLSLRKFILHSRFAQIGATLFRHERLRIGCDCYAPDLPPGLSLQNISSAKPLAGGVFISLRSGDALFVHPHHVLSWEQIGNPEDFLLITYAPTKALYYLEPKDPHTHAWKRLGYVFGDRLNDANHPFVTHS